MKTVCQDIPAARAPHHDRGRPANYFCRSIRTGCTCCTRKGGQGVAKVTPSDLIASNMRMKPDRVLLAELAGRRGLRFYKAPDDRPQRLSHLLPRGVLCPGDGAVCVHGERARTGRDLRCDALKRLVALTIDVIVHVMHAPCIDDAAIRAKKERYRRRKCILTPSPSCRPVRQRPDAPGIAERRKRKQDIVGCVYRVPCWGILC